ncbi:MAG: lytic transglycosylase domain-containing protein [Anaerolineales bacterium]
MRQKAAASSFSLDDRAAAPEPGSGCLSFFVLPPLAVLLVATVLSIFSAQLPLPSPAPSPLPQGQIAALFTPEVRHWESAILHWSQIYQLDANLIATVMQIESCGDPFARSAAGAMGLFQVMPYHFADGENPFDVETNAKRGLAYLKKALRSASGDVRLALAAYNGGMARLGQEEWMWPGETQRYVYWGAGIYEEARRGQEVSARLQEWLEQGGRSLCAQARSRQP